MRHDARGYCRRKKGRVVNDRVKPAATPAPRLVRMPLGVVVRQSPGVTRWAAWAWRVTAVLPGAGPADWKVLRREDGVTEYHAATPLLELHRAVVEGYKVALAMTPPSVFVVLRPLAGAARPMVHGVTASAYEAQDFTDNAEDIVEPVAMPPALHGWISAFTDAHFNAEPFVKRRRDAVRTDRTEDGIGDPRVRQVADVYRAPGAQRQEDEA